MDKPILDFPQWQAARRAQAAPFWFIVSVLTLSLVTIGGVLIVAALVGR